MLDLIGRGYVIDHCVSTLIVLNKEEIYRNYVTQALKAISVNTSKEYGGEYMKTDFYSIINPPKEEKRTAEEIIEQVTSKIKGVQDEPDGT